ncbi:hypothetical protein PUNSTDRAFT_133202 [Punctularia strigosozonata HHB-11173 SS5]|uniref:uncharacterized protein n=1 Tax=Punctularia strigosozonata (strain HHB-11173) TaxID=741275 RepID=UPI0004416F0A|nr:uncharacterized protein PUNSTDRAFT_133202 [Punctularia strigosozonata HHB-11173 SS5]EIN09410.1 hypothetical protein PUNSTDRAFT_133202 [Punctularia strigosozonata HHB-11173 SS5]
MASVHGHRDNIAETVPNCECDDVRHARSWPPWDTALRLYDEFVMQTALEPLSRSIEICEALLLDRSILVSAPCPDDRLPHSDASNARLPPSSLKRHHVLIQLSLAIRRRYQFTGVKNDLEQAMRYGRDSLDLSQAEGIFCPTVWTIYAELLRLNADDCGLSDDRDAAERMSRTTLQRCPAGHPLRPPAFRTLAIILVRRYAMTRQSVFIEESTRCLEEALGQIPATSLNLADYLGMLGFALSFHWEGCRDIGMLEDAIRLGKRAIALLPPRHFERGFIEQRLSAQMLDRFHCTGDPEDLEEAHSIAKAALEHAVPGRRVYRLTSLINVLMASFSHALGTDQDLDELIRTNEEAIRICPPKHDMHPGVLNNMATACKIRFERHGLPADLEKSIELHRELLELLPTSHPRRCISQHNLANTLCLHFQETGIIESLNEAISLYRQISQARSPKHHPLDPADLANALCLRYQTLHHAEDLEEAVKLGEDSVAYVTANIREKVEVACTLADALLRRGKHNQSLCDVEHALRILEETEAADPLYASKNPSFMHILALTYDALYHHTRQRDDAGKAVRIMQQSLSLLPVGRRDRSRYLLDIAELHLAENNPDCNPALALDYIYQGITEDHQDVRPRLLQAVRLLQLIEIHHLPVFLTDVSLRAQLVGVYATVVGMLPRVAFLGVDLPSRLQALGIGRNIAITGAAHALAISRPETALEILEQGRAIYWTQVLRLRSPFDSVPVHLRQRLLTLARQLEHSDDPSVDSVSDRRVIERQSSRRRQQSDEFNLLLKQIRAMPGLGLERFMMHDEFSSLALAAEKGPVVVLVSSASGCYAVVMKSPQSSPITLHLSGVADEWLQDASDEISDAVMAKSLSSARLKLVKVPKTSGSRVESSRIYGILTVLWERVVSPVFRALNLKPAVGRDRPRLWWCPTGHFTHLPVHAATTDRESSMDYVVSSYTPTLGALINARRSYEAVARSTTKMLLAAVPRPFTYDWIDLPHTINEIRRVASSLPFRTRITIPQEDDAMFGEENGMTAQMLLDKLPEATLLHLACHGRQDAECPLNSGFVMRDKLLTIEELVPIPLPRAFLAFLSACETAKGDKNQPDQTIHLAAAMLFAGFKSVIATLWSMEDVDGPMVAESVYKEIFDGDSEYIHPDTVPYALDTAVQRLRQEHPDPNRWAPYIHLGM